VTDTVTRSLLIPLQSEKNETGSEVTTPVNDPIASIDPTVEKKLLRKIDGYVISLLGVSSLQKC
jgi:hypothetical protein